MSYAHIAAAAPKPNASPHAAAFTGQGRSVLIVILGAEIEWRLNQSLSFTEREYARYSLPINCCYGITGTSASPAASSKPNMMFMHYTPYPAAPLTRLSSTTKKTTKTPPTRQNT